MCTMRRSAIDFQFAYAAERFCGLDCRQGCKRTRLSSDDDLVYSKHANDSESGDEYGENQWQNDLYVTE